MKVNLYVVFDRVAEEAGPVFQAKNDGVALRYYRDLIAKQAKPEEFDLVQVGEFDTESCDVSHYRRPVSASADLTKDAEEIST